MTILDAIKTLPFEAGQALIQKVLIDFGLNGNMVYSQAVAQAVDLCMAEICRYKLTEPDVSEGELSIKIDRAAIAQFRNDILAKYSQQTGGISSEVVW
jgi:hypothetical protein